MNVHAHASAPTPVPRAASAPRTPVRLRPAGAVAGLAAALLLAGCGGVLVRPADQVPPPLVDEIPLRTGVHYSAEFRDFAHREERWGTKWEAQLGGAHVTKLGRLLVGMFPGIVEVEDLARPPEPPLQLILEPRFEEYSFITPRDAGAEYYAVTIKYRMNLYDGRARLIDSLVYTGYGSAEGGGLSTEAPLVEATQRAMRDAGAKFATEFAEQATVQKLVRGEPVAPVTPGGAPATGGIEEVKPPVREVGPAATAAPAPGPVAPSAAPSPSPSPSPASASPPSPAPVEPPPSSAPRPSETPSPESPDAAPPTSR